MILKDLPPKVLELAKKRIEEQQEIFDKDGENGN